MRHSLSKIIILFSILLISKNLCGQIILQSENPEQSLIEYLDGKRFSVPDYGTMTFDLNRKALKEFKEKMNNAGDEGEKIELKFQLKIKRVAEKKKDKEDYYAIFTIYPDIVDKNLNTFGSPNKIKYLYDFYIIRNVIHPIKNFPFNFILFADGDMYYEKIKFKDLTFLQYKNQYLSGAIEKNKSNTYSFDFESINYVKCPVLESEKKRGMLNFK